MGGNGKYYLVLNVKQREKKYNYVKDVTRIKAEHYQKNLIHGASGNVSEDLQHFRLDIMEGLVNGAVLRTIRQ